MRIRSQGVVCDDRCTHAIAVAGRCNAHSRARTKLCAAWPIRGRSRCRMHGGRSTGPRSYLARIQALRELELSDDERQRLDAFLEEWRAPLERLGRASLVVERLSADASSDGQVAAEAIRAAQTDVRRARRALHEIANLGVPAAEGLPSGR